MMVKIQQMVDPKFWEVGRHPVLWFSFLGWAVSFGAGSWLLLSLGLFGILALI